LRFFNADRPHRAVQAARPDRRDVRDRCRDSLPRKQFSRHFRKHRVTPRQLAAIYPTGPLSHVRALKKPILYKHPGGGSWVTLSEDNVTEFKRLQSN
jgi:hypothetical protein